MLARACRIPSSRIVLHHRTWGVPYVVEPVGPDRGSPLPEGHERKAAVHQAEECCCPSGRNSWSKIKVEGMLLSRGLHTDVREGKQGCRAGMQRRSGGNCVHRVASQIAMLHSHVAA